MAVTKSLVFVVWAKMISYHIIWNILTRLNLHGDDKVSSKGQDIYKKIYHFDEDYALLYINETD